MKRMMQLKLMTLFAPSGLLVPTHRPWDHPVHAPDLGPLMSGDEWISGPRAATLLGVSRSTMLRVLADPERREQEWGVEGEGWRHKPLSTRGVIEVRRTAVEAKLKPGS
jgi:hypothetical protein